MEGHWREIRKKQNMVNGLLQIWRNTLTPELDEVPAKERLQTGLLIHHLPSPFEVTGRACPVFTFWIA